ncbi:MAG: CBS domain-containing protein [Thermodesulfobacteriota bacterium]
MKRIPVKDLMVPLAEYATVSEEATLYEAYSALEAAQNRLDRDRYLYLHRAVLVHDKNNEIVGKVSQLDALRALEPKYLEMGDPGRLSRAGFSAQFLKSMMENAALWENPLKDICTKAARRKVKHFMHTLSEGEFIDAKATLEEAIHLLLMGHHQSLLVKEGKGIVGILRLTDVFAEVFHMMKSCEI